MNHWTKLSIQYANTKSYLDDLYKVYPIRLNPKRALAANFVDIEKAYKKKDDLKLIKYLIKLKKFPIKHSYVGFIKKDKSAIDRNPKIIKKICEELYNIGFDEFKRGLQEPMEPNRQIGPMFNKWIISGGLGIKPVEEKIFKANTNNAILRGSDKSLMQFAKHNFGYNQNKGIDLIARFNNNFILGETKFITSEGGNQNKSMLDALNLKNAKTKNCKKIGILDGIIYLEGNTKLYKDVSANYKDFIIMSSLILKNYLESL